MKRSHATQAHGVCDPIFVPFVLLFFSVNKRAYWNVYDENSFLRPCGKRLGLNKGATSGVENWINEPVNNSVENCEKTV